MDDAGRDGGRDGGRDAAMVDASMTDDASMMDDASTMDDGGEGDGSVATCGDGVVGGDEECDDGAANSDTAADACRTDCTAAGCGDGVTDTGETCDGADLGGSTCVDQGFVSGVLACAAACDAFDTTMCSGDPGPVCGDAMVEGTEECEAGMLGGRTCADELGAGAIGTLACTSCMYDAAACTFCGNGTIDAGEACDGADLGGATCPSGGTLACSATCTLDMSGCTSVPGPTAAGQIVITEITQNPAAFGDTDGEWLELHNPGATALQLMGCVVSGNGSATDRFTIDTSVVVAAGGYATFAVSTTVADAPGFTPSFRWPPGPGGFALANASDEVTVTCGGTVIDTVTYDNGATFPDPNGASMSLSPSSLDATANDLGTNWCEATSTYGAGATPDRGTPGAANDVCPVIPVWAVTFCRLQFPETITDDIGTSHTVYGRVYAAGLTDMTTATDVSSSLHAELGYGPDASDPASTAGWTWITATPNVGWIDTSEPNNDEYQATLVAPGPAGSYDYAYRFSGDSGATWVYCDTLAPGSTDGYLVANAGQLTTTMPTTTANLWINEIHYDDESTDADEGVEIAGAAGTVLAGYSVVAYNGSGGASYDTEALIGTIPDQGGGFGTLWFPIVGLQNGAPDGLALVGPLGVVQFLCYEGSFAATDGPAMGTTCVDIGVAEAGEVDMSLQLTGTGGTYSAFTWQPPAAQSRGTVNPGQTIM